MSIFQDDLLPSTYRSKQEFLASLPPWRRLLATLNWHPTIDKKVARYAIEQSLLQLEKEDAQLEEEDAQLARADAQLRNEDAQHAERLKRMQELNARIAALWPSSPSSSTQAPPPGSDSPT